MATEIEIKRLLDADGFARLRAHLDGLVPAQCQQQVNHYLDLPDAALRQAGAMLRLRAVGERLVLTLKARASVTHGVLHAQELERALATDEERAFWQRRPLRWQDAAARIADWLHAAGLGALAGRDSPLLEVGNSANMRRIYRIATGIPGWPQPLTLELDHTRYPGDVDRLELECEHADAVALAPVLDAWLAALGVAATQATETKYAQFLRLGAAAPLAEAGLPAAVQGA